MTRRSPEIKPRVAHYRPDLAWAMGIPESESVRVAGAENDELPNPPFDGS